MKFARLVDLKDALKLAGEEGVWVQTAGNHRFDAEEGGSAYYYPNSGLVSIQGPAAARGRIAERLNNARSMAEDTGPSGLPKAEPPRLRRKIVQMAKDSEGYITILCDDGSLWNEPGAREKDGTWRWKPSEIKFPDEEAVK